MASSKRKLFFGLILLSINNCPATCQITKSECGSQPAKNYPSSRPLAPQLLKSLLTVASTNGILPEVLPSIQKIFPETQEIIANGGIPQTMAVETPIAPATPTYKETVKINSYPTNNIPRLRKPFFPYRTGPPNCLSAGDTSITGILSEPLQMPSPTAVSQFPVDSQVESVTEEYLPQAYIIPPIPQPQPTPIENVISSPNCHEINQAPVTVQIPLLPSLNPYAIATPRKPLTLNNIPHEIQLQQNFPQEIQLPQNIPQEIQLSQNTPQAIQTPQNIVQEIQMPLNIPQEIHLSQNIPQEIQTPQNIVQEIQLPQNIPQAIQWPQIIPQTIQLSQNIPQAIQLPSVVPEVYTNSLVPQVPVLSPIIVEPLVSVPSPPIVPNVFGSAGGCGQLPFDLYINVQPPSLPEPMITLIPSQNFEPNTYCQPNPTAGAGMYSNPVIVTKKSRSYWKFLLPLLLIDLFDGGNMNCGGSNGGSNIPIPYPIPIPVNNPIIVRGKKSKVNNKNDEDENEGQIMEED